MNRNLNSKSSSSFLASLSYYVKQSREMIVVGGVAGAIASILAIGFHFPGW